jgi:MFS family permease
MMEINKFTSRSFYILIINIIISSYISVSIPQLIFLNNLTDINNIGFAMGVYTSTALFLASILGKIVDKFSSKVILIVSNGITILVLFAYLIYPQNIIFYIMIFVLSSINLLIQINIWSFVAKEIDKEYITKYNSTTSLATTVTMIISPIINSVIIKSYNQYTIIILSIILSVLVFLMGFTLPSFKNSEDENSSTKQVGVIRILFSSKILILIMICTILINLSFSIINVVMVPYLVSIGTESYIAITYASYFSIGAIIGSLYLKKYKIKNMYKFCLQFIVIPVIVYIILTLFNNYILIFIGGALISLARTFGATIRTTLQQENIPVTHMGSVLGLCTTITWGVNPIGSIATGFLSNFINSNELMIISYVIMLIGSLLMLKIAKY